MTDLRNGWTASTLHDEADEDAQAVRRLRGRAVRCTLLSAVLAAVLAGVSQPVGASAQASTWVVGAVVLAVIVARGLHAWIAAHGARRRLRRIRRWRHAPRASADASTAATRVTACDPPLSAPISGRACLGWEVVISRPTRSTLRAPHEIRLVEQRHCGFEAEGATLEPDQAWLALAREPYDSPHDGQPWPAGLAEFLRYRGFDTTQTLQIHESIIPVDADCSLERDLEGRLRLSARGHAG